jgi:hypothetical protein
MLKPGMTRLKIHEEIGEEFIVQGCNVLTEADDDEIVFYKDITKVHVLPDRESFTIQVISPALVIEMDFADAGSVREALALFEAKKVLEVRSEVLGSVRILPSTAEAAET